MLEDHNEPIGASDARQLGHESERSAGGGTHARPAKEVELAVLERKLIALGELVPNAGIVARGRLEHARRDVGARERPELPRQVPVGEPDTAPDVERVEARRIAQVALDEPDELLGLGAGEEVVIRARKQNGVVELLPIPVPVLVVSVTRRT